VEFHLSRPVLYLVYVAFGILVLPLLDPGRFNIPLSGLPFGVIDYVFFGLGGAGLLLVPHRAVPEAIPVWIPLIWSISLLVSAFLAADVEVALKQAIAMVAWGGSAIGVSRLAADMRVRRAFVVVLAVFGLRWAFYVLGAYQGLPPFSSFSWFQAADKGTVNHNTVGQPIAMFAGWLAGYFFARKGATRMLWAGVALGAAAVVISMCLSRQNLIALGVGTLVALVGLVRATRGLVAIVAVTAVIGFVADRAAESGVFGDRAEKIQQRYDPTDMDSIRATSGQREGLLMRGVDFALRLPRSLVGIGGGNFPYTQPDGSPRYTRGPVMHNEHLTIFVEGGALAFIAWLALLRRTSLVSLRRLRPLPVDAGLITTALVLTVVLLAINARGLHLWWCFAIVAAAVAASRAAVARDASTGGGRP
jgi:hypothetical protein